MRTLVKVQGHDKLSKDAQSGGVINNDLDGLKAAKAAKQKILESQNKIDSLEQRINQLEELFKRALEERQ